MQQAGLWGAKTGMNRKLSIHVLSNIIESWRRRSHLNEPMPTKYDDQNLLMQHLYQHLNGKVSLLLFQNIFFYFNILGNVLVHDSYHCGRFPLSKTVPFPTQRLEEESYNFVGAQIFGNVEPVLDICPPPCRPVDHKDWQYC